MSWDHGTPDVHPGTGSVPGSVGSVVSGLGEYPAPVSQPSLGKLVMIPTSGRPRPAVWRSSAAPSLTCATLISVATHERYAV
jgi:hypothetical protein